MLYELVTGVRAFAAASAAETLAVGRAQPKRPSQVVATVPRELERVILRCLRKEPDRRYQAMLDVKIELQEIQEESHSGGLALAIRPQRRYRGRVAAAVPGVVAVVGATAWLYWRPAVGELPAMRVRPLTIAYYYGAHARRRSSARCDV
jgi:eukaryotic-like serine/threonine-protein kinase